MSAAAGTSDSNEMASNTKIAIALVFIAALMAANTAVAVRDLQGACIRLCLSQSVPTAQLLPVPVCTHQHRKNLCCGPAETEVIAAPALDPVNYGESHFTLWWTTCSSKWVHTLTAALCLLQAATCWALRQASSRPSSLPSSAPSRRGRWVSTAASAVAAMSALCLLWG